MMEIPKRQFEAIIEISVSLTIQIGTPTTGQTFKNPVCI